MSHPPHRDPDPELEDIRELGLIERQHRQAARALGVSRGTMGVIWLVPLAIFVIVLVALFLSMR
ncbi:hypothetical protein HCU64_14485 [Methylobacterium sp. C25]|uniref:hypothetical protein n=1 Tax=Methylobacterium sp. C25 TaxID=2721622 RepID=UPI001F2D48C2|nr:hypothetical protein [Methylobacterium sp. C25]MCE4224967.1 hypothetical protein [Methylobacterium sp. C25]